jgi:hypothetical protein
MIASDLDYESCTSEGSEESNWLMSAFLWVTTVAS